MEEKRATFRGAMRIGSSLPVLKRLYAGYERRLGFLVGASLLGGFAQAAVLVSLVNVGIGLAAGDDTLAGSLGPVGGFNTDSGTLLWFALALLLVVIVLDIVTGIVAARISVGVLTRERVNTYRAYSEATWSVQAAERDGHLQELLSRNAGWTGTAVNSSTAGAIAACNLAALGASAMILEPLVAVVLALAIGVLVVAARPMAGAVRRQTEALSAMNVDFANVVARNVGLAQDIRTFDVGDEIRARVEADVDELSNRWYRIRLINRLSPAIFRNAALLLLIGAVAAVYVSGRGDLAALGAVVVIILRALGYANGVQRSVQEIHNAVPWLEQLWTRTEEFVANRTETGDAALPEIERLAFSNVGFAYDNDDAGSDQPNVLTGIDFTVDRGESIGVVGPSGAGKSTLVKLLLRLHDPTTGAILVNGEPAESAKLSDWYRRVGYVPQNVLTFNGTIAENISFFRPWVSDKAVEAAARRAHLHDEIVAMPDGYRTLVGERAGRLSGGQRQRLALARALVSSPDILVLDEPTSALDMTSESLVQQTLDELRGNTTLIIVAHRISTLSSCQRIMVLEAGQLTALDTAEKVRETNDFFREATRLARL